MRDACSVQSPSAPSSHLHSVSTFLRHQAATLQTLFDAAADLFGLAADRYALKLILKGKALQPGATAAAALAAAASSTAAALQLVETDL